MLLAGVLSMGMGLAAAPVLAQSKNQKLYEAFKKAAYVLYEEKKFEEAIVQFEKAYEAVPDPKIWFNLGQCHRQLNHVEQALMYYEKFLAALPEIQDLPAAKKRVLETEVRDWVTQLQKQKEEEDARLREEEARQKAREQAKSQGTQEPAGTPASEKEGGEKAKDGGTPAAGETDASLTSRWWFWTGIGATAIFTGVTVWAGLRAQDYNDQWRQMWDTKYHDKAVQYQNFTDAALAGAIVSAVITGIASWISLRDTGSASAGKTAFFAPACDGTSCMLQLTLFY